MLWNVYFFARVHSIDWLWRLLKDFTCNIRINKCMGLGMLKCTFVFIYLYVYVDMQCLAGEAIRKIIPEKNPIRDVFPFHCVSSHCMSSHWVSSHCVSVHCVSSHCVSSHCVSPPRLPGTQAPRHPGTQAPGHRAPGTGHRAPGTRPLPKSAANRT